MIAKKAGIVEAIIDTRPGAQEIEVRVGSDLHPAINYPTLTGEAEVGDTVIINTTATELKLGTGGFDFVIHNSAVEFPEPSEGHLMKLRYTPLQFAALAAEEKFADQMPESLDGTPVIACSLHSQIAPVAFAIRSKLSDAKIVYLMTDSAALPLGFSRVLPLLKEEKLISATITCGQAFGGDLEAVNLYSGMLLAKGVLQADAIIVSQGPGNTGTGTKWGFSAIDQGLALNAAASLGGQAICCPRISFADPRPRHQGISHQTIRILKDVALKPCLVAFPVLETTQSAILMRMWDEHQLAEKHTYQLVAVDNLFDELLASVLLLNSMGRGAEDDPAFFKAGLAAGLAIG